MPQETKRIPLPTILASRDPTTGKDGLLVNCYAEQGPDAKRIVKRPGTTLFSNLGGNCPGQGAFFFAGGPVFIACDTFFPGEDVPPVCIPSPPIDPRYVYLGVDSTVANGSAPVAVVDPITKWVWTAQRAFLTNVINIVVVSDIGAQVIATFSEAETFVQLQSITAVTSLSEVWVLLRMNQNAIPKVARFSSGTAAIDGTASVAPTFIGVSTLSAGPANGSAIGYDSATNRVWVAYNFTTATPVAIAVFDPSTLALIYSAATGISIGGPFQFVFGYPYVALLGSFGPSQSSGGKNFVVFDASLYGVLSSQYISGLGTVGKVADYDSVRRLFIALLTSGLNYGLIDALTGAITYHTLSMAIGHDTVPPPSTQAQILSMTYFNPLDKYIFGQNSVSTTQASTLYVVNPDTLESQYTYTYEVGATNLLINTLFPAANGNCVLGFDLTHVKRLCFGVPC